MSNFFIDAQSDGASAMRPIRVLTSDDRLKSVAARYDDAPDEDAVELDAPPMVPSDSSEPAGPLSIGEQLMRGMSRDAKKTNPEALKAIAASTHARCVPTVVGGFLGAGGTTHAATDVRVGLILSRMTPTVAAAGSTGTPTTTALTNAVVFKREEDITDEESTLGAAVTEATVNDIFQVTRIDSAKDTCEVAFADGDRAVVLRTNIRPATAQEIALFHKWLRDPVTLPSDGLRRKRLRYEGQPDGKQRLMELLQRHDSSRHGGASSSPALGGGGTAPTLVRWIQKRLVVRYVSEDRPHLTGCKFVVANVNHKDDRVLLQTFVDPTDGKGVSPTAAPLVEVAAHKDLETVLPKVGCLGLVLQGPHRGEMATMVRREKDADTGETIRVVVKPTRQEAHDGNADLSFALGADAFCLMGTL